MVALLPNVAPDTFGLACPHHLGHDDGGHGSHAHPPGPHSDPHAPLAEHASNAHRHAPAHGSHAGHDAAAASMPASAGAPLPGPSGPAPGGPDAPPPCTCVGTCTVSGSAPAPVRQDVAPIPGTILAEIRRATARDRLLVPTPYALPWANAPPAV